ncbi:hypothetical protein AB0C02_21725 [Micromonospora sp. NPDC048999]|uniref:hypothetical protein n=1 Tax=Micromonospora sp. NPDC048999 TaxID=3155391 RepID=UPI0033F5C61F
MPKGLSEVVPPPEILGPGDQLQVSRIDAGPVSAEVINFMAWRYVTDECGVGETVPTDTLAVGHDRTVAVASGSSNQIPAGVGLLDRRDEARNMRLYLLLSQWHGRL